MKALVILLVSFVFIGSTLAGTENNFYKKFDGILIDKNGKKVKDSDLSKAKYIAVYYSASWCPPCRRFTPQLTKFYTDTAKSKGIEIVLYGSDRTEDKQNSYLKHMDFPGIKFSKRADTGLKEFCGRGIPCLTVFDASGKVVIDGRKMHATRVLQKLKELIK